MILPYPNCFNFCASTFWGLKSNTQKCTWLWQTCTQMTTRPKLRPNWFRNFLFPWRVVNGQYNHSFSRKFSLLCEHYSEVGNVMWTNVMLKGVLSHQYCIFCIYVQKAVDHSPPPHSEHLACKFFDRLFKKRLHKLLLQQKSTK